MLKGYAILQCLLDKKRFAHTSSAIYGDKLWSFTVIQLVQFCNFLFSSYYHSLKTCYILPQKYEKHSLRQNMIYYILP